MSIVKHPNIRSALEGTNPTTVQNIWQALPRASWYMDLISQIREASTIDGRWFESSVSMQSIQGVTAIVILCVFRLKGLITIILKIATLIFNITEVARSSFWVSSKYSSEILLCMIPFYNLSGEFHEKFLFGYHKELLIPEISSGVPLGNQSVVSI